MKLLSKYAADMSCAAIVLALVGCGQAPTRISINGTVTFKGTPIADGWITFVPKDAEKGTQEAAHIVDGKYQLPAANGLLPGEYRVAITATQAPAQPAATAAPGALARTGRRSPMNSTVHPNSKSKCSRLESGNSISNSIDVTRLPMHWSHYLKVPPCSHHPNGVHSHSSSSWW